METISVMYEGIEFDVVGEYVKEDSTTGFESGWSTFLIMVNDKDIGWMLRDDIFERISELVNEKR